jgi:hypothetical protein
MLYDFKSVDIAPQGIENELVFLRAGLWETKRRGEMAGTETGCYS